jgi:hypothetical protein
METDIRVEFWNLPSSNIEKIVSLSKDHYREGHRDELVFGLSGMLFKNKVAFTSAENLIDALCNQAEDEEKDNRFRVLQNTYLKALNGNEISGAAHLLEVLTLVCNNDKSIAFQILQQISDILHTGRKQNDANVIDNGDGNNSSVQENVSQTLS